MPPVGGADGQPLPRVQDELQGPPILAPPVQVSTPLDLQNTRMVISSAATSTAQSTYQEIPSDHGAIGVGELSVNVNAQSEVNGGGRTPNSDHALNRL